MGLARSPLMHRGEEKYYCGFVRESWTREPLPPFLVIRLALVSSCHVKTLHAVITSN